MIQNELNRLVQSGKTNLCRQLWHKTFFIIDYEQEWDTQYGGFQLTSNCARREDD